MPTTWMRGLGVPLELFFRHRTLTLALAKREILDRYTGQMLGALWVVGHPILLVTVYVFVFQYVFKMRVGGTAEMPLDYTVYLLSGMIPWLTFTDVLTKAPMIMHVNSSLVKQVVFPIEVLPVKVVLGSLVSQLLCSGLLIVYLVAVHGVLPWTLSLLPLLWLAQVLTMIGISMALAAAGAYVRDLKEIVQVFCSLGIYLMPVAYLPEWVPESVRPALYFNPFSYMTWCYQDACFFGRIEHVAAWAVFLPGSLVAFVIGFALFRRLKVYFGSVL